MIEFHGPYVKGGSLDGGGILSGPVGSTGVCPECGTGGDCHCHDLPPGICARCEGTGATGGAEEIDIPGKGIRVALVNRVCADCGGTGAITP